MIKPFIFIIPILVISLLSFLLVSNPKVEGGMWLSLFALFVLVEKLWETFFTSKQKDVRKYQGDWTLMLTSVMYAVAGFLIIFEFFFTAKKINLIILLSGVAVYIFSGVLRFWSIKTLGKQWNIHLIEEIGISKLVIKGPYKHIRHPIYLGHFLELVGMALTFNAIYSLIFIFLINLPLYIQRALYEEKKSLKKFGKEYIIYMKNVSFMLPVKMFKVSRNVKK
jgi:protein-S-isoprenylcysteine O-methyltransferase Ste14